MIDIHQSNKKNLGAVAPNPDASPPNSRIRPTSAYEPNMIYEHCTGKLFRDHKSCFNVSCRIRTNTKTKILNRHVIQKFFGH